MVAQSIEIRGVHSNQCLVVHPQTLERFFRGSHEAIVADLEFPDNGAQAANVPLISDVVFEPRQSRSIKRLGREL